MFHNISDSLMVRTSVLGDKLMLHCLGAFSDKNLSSTKILALLDNKQALQERIDNWQEGAQELDGIDVVYSTWNNNKMIQVLGGFKTFRVSANITRAILAHDKELRKIIRDNPVATVAKEDETIARQQMERNRASMPTDKKSPVDVSAIETRFDEILTGYAQGTLTDFASWMSVNYDVTKEQARAWIDDKEYSAEFSAYLESSKVAVRPQKRAIVQRPVKRMTVDEMAQGTEKMQKSAKRIAELNAEIAQIESNGKLSPETIAMAKRLEKATGQKFDAAPKEKTKKGRGIPVSFSVITNIGKTNITRANSGIDAIRLLKGKTLIHPQTKESRLVDDRGENNSHWYATLVKDGYIFDVKRLDA